MKAGEALDRSLAVLAVTASQALYLTKRAPATDALRGLLDTTRHFVAPVEADRVLGPELHALAQAFTTRVFDHA
jgi:histidine ammonia-lyase